MAAVNISSSPITQVSQHHVPTHTNLQPQLLTRLFLDLRGKRFEVDRETIMNLPESVLLCLFPNGLVLSRQSVALSEGGDEEDEEVYGVDVSIWTMSTVKWRLISLYETVRPRMFPICSFFLPERVRDVLWHCYVARPFERAATPAGRVEFQ